MARINPRSKSFIRVIRAIRGLLELKRTAKDIHVVIMNSASRGDDFLTADYADLADQTEKTFNYPLPPRNLRLIDD